MLISDRRRRILDHVRRHGSASIAALATALQVSPSTVRRDLLDLERAGLVRRAYGGAVAAAGQAAATPEPDAPAVGTDEDAAAAKARIGTRAAAELADDSTVMMLAGSTTAAVIPALYHRRLTVVTNGLEIAHALKHAPEISVVVLGGYLHREQMTLLGPMTVAAMQSLHIDVMLAGAWGVDPVTGVTGNKIIQAGNHDGMLRQVDRLVILADSSKLGRRGPTRLADIEQVDTLITDADAPESVRAALRARGPNVVVA